MKFVIALLFVATTLLDARNLSPVPKVYANVTEDGRFAYHGQQKFRLMGGGAKYTREMLMGHPRGTKKGFTFHFIDEKEKCVLHGGRLYYALIDLREPFPTPKFKRSVKISDDGRASVKITGKLGGKYDFIDWERTGRGDLFYRVEDADKNILFEGMFHFFGKGPFRVDAGSIVAGPVLTFSEKVGLYRIAFDTLRPVIASVCTSDGNCVKEHVKSTRHELLLTNMSKPSTQYDYTITTSQHVTQRYSLKTPPEHGSRKAFSFAFASDSRKGIRSGERDIAGVNAYMMKRIAALINAKDAAFFQFTGDMIDGYASNPAMQQAQLASWFRSIWPLGAKIPMQTAMGNHEALVASYDDKSRYGFSVDRFPFAQNSAEAVYGAMVANPQNGPVSEDGQWYDPTTAPGDFPSYKENVYSYTYGNVAMVVLNTNYWYAPSVQRGRCLIGGNPHGYLMNNQIAWLEKTLDGFEKNGGIDHVFVTMHTPAWPNGGHVHDDMFYNGKNVIRPCIAGEGNKKVKAKEGIIERRDRLWDMLQRHPKVIATLTGDEHNYARMHVRHGMPTYASDGFKPQTPLRISRPIWQIHNGAAGAPYYAMQKTPWNADFDPIKGQGKYLKNFTTQNAVVIFYIDGKTVRLEVLNPLTLLPIDEAKLR